MLTAIIILFFAVVLVGIVVSSMKKTEPQPKPHKPGDFSPVGLSGEPQTTDNADGTPSVKQPEG